MRHPRESPAGEAGQTFVEWLGAMAFVVVLVTLLVAAAPGVADSIVNFISDAIKALTP
jgi:energy-converting hydrogenase Eha subunit E